MSDYNPSDYIRQIRQNAKDLFKMRTLASCGKPGAFRQAREMVPFGFDFNGINVEVHPQETKLKGIVLLNLIGMTYNAKQKDVVVRDLGRVVCLPEIRRS